MEEDNATTPKQGVIAYCIASVLIVGILLGGMVAIIQITSENATERRNACAANGGSWVKDNQCLRLVQIVESGSTE